MLTELRIALGLARRARVRSFRVSVCTVWCFLEKKSCNATDSSHDEN